MGRLLPFWAFLAVAVPIVLTPGASTAVVLRNSIAGGTRAGVQTALGANAGSLCYGLLTAFGFALLLRRMPNAWTVLRLAGISYLAWLGVQSLRHAYRLPDSGMRAAAAAPAVARPWIRNLQDGFLTNVLNPALATFYLVVLPQFIPRGAPVVASALVLTAVHITIALSTHVVWAAAGGTLAHRVADGWPRRVLDSIAGVAMLALAASLLAR
jgi:threonine/homoserine/homoserine lactone efflux protein